MGEGLSINLETTPGATTLSARSATHAINSANALFGRKILARGFKYESLFDLLEFGDGAHMEYTGSLRDVLDELETEITRGAEASRVKLILHPPRILRALLDWKVDSTDSNDGSVDLIKKAIKLGISVYTKSSDALTILKELRADIRAKPYARIILDTELHQQSDSRTWEATKDTSSAEKAAKQISASVQKKPVLFVALAHGGVAAGMDVFLRYRARSKNNDSTFYAARFSRYKRADSKPHLREEEIAYLREQSLTREIVLYDEDITTGSTMLVAKRYFESDVFPGRTIYRITNHLL